MKRSTLLFGLSLVLLAALWGCGGQAQNQSPTASFEILPGEPKAGEAVAFNGGASKDADGSIAKYEWTFPGGASAQGVTASHTFAEPGTYEVSLKVTDDKNAVHTAKKSITVAAAVAAEPEPEPEPEPAVTPGVQLAEHIQMSQGTQIRIPIGAEPRYLLPNATEGTWESSLSNLMFDPLVESNDNMESIPSLAQSWEYDPETFTYTFHLRQDVRFHDYVTSQETLDCGDVMFSFHAWIHPDYPGVRYNSGYENIVGAQAYHDGESADWPIEGLKCLDNHTFQVTLTQVQRTFLPYGANAGIMPQHMYEAYLEENGYGQLKGADTELGIVGTGAYRLDEWSKAQYLKLKRFDENWRGRWGRQVEIEDQVAFPGIESAYFVVMPDPDAQYAALLAGEVDVLDTRSNVDQYFQLAENDNFNTYVYPQLTYDYWHWNLRNELFQDVRVRKAMCYALDRQQMVDNVLRGLGELTNGPSHPLRWDWDPTLDQIHPNFDVEKTVELMEEAGWTIAKNADGSIQDGAVWTKTKDDGTVLEMSFEIAHNTPNPRRQDFALIMQQQLKAAGFKSTVRPMETNAFYNDYLQGANAFETAIAGWRLGTDPDGTSLWHSKSLDPNGFNWIAYSNPEVDRLLEEGLQYAEIDKARPIYQEIAKLLVEDMGYCWLAFPSATFAAKPTIDGMTQWSPLDPYSHMTEWFIAGKGLPVTVME